MLRKLWIFFQTRLQRRSVEAITGTGTIKANAVEWSMTASGPRGNLKLAFKGKVEGETMSGEAQMGDTGAYTWTAKRKK
jgi:hypothetical protein